jgi:hypothetical protein
MLSTNNDGFKKTPNISSTWTGNGIDYNRLKAHKIKKDQQLP